MDDEMQSGDNGSGFPEPRREAITTIRVLLVEDNVGFAYHVRDALTWNQPHRQFKLDHVTALGPALEILREQAPDVVLLDLNLPDSKGLRTFRSIRAATPRTPVIILTVLDDDEMAMTAMRQGAQDYLVKNRAEKDLILRSIRYSIARADIEGELRCLSSRLLQLQDEERRRVARSLHDITAQDLAAVSMNLSLLDGALKRKAPKVKSLLSESIAFVEKCSKELRTMSYLLHPPLLDELGLAGAVRDYVDGFAERSGIRMDLELPTDLGRLPGDVETALFRVMQESLANVHRHSESRTASVSISVSDSEIALRIRDAGRGISPGRVSEGRDAMAGIGVGIGGMRERLGQLGGRLEIDTGERGTTITATLPFTERDTDGSDADTDR